MHMVTRERLQAAKTSDTEVVTEASQAGLRPGEWPDFLTVTSEARPNSGFLFLRDDRPSVDAEGEIIAYTYRGQMTATGFSIVLLND